MNTFRVFTVSVLLAVGVCIACGGSSSGSVDINMAGTWSGTLQQTQSSCPVTREATSGAFTHTVNQNGNAIALADSQGTSFLGAAVNNSGFSVAATLSAAVDSGDGIPCDTTQRIDYSGIDTEGDNDAAVTVTTNVLCTDNASCETVSQAVAVRGAAPAPTESATATPSVGPTPGPDEDMGVDEFPDRCDELSEITYSGDNECGIAETSVAVETSGDTVTVFLDPLGANGVTSFTVDAGDPDRASATRDNLQISGEDGYTCSLRCGGRLTFTVVCRKEGGSTCEERF